MAPVAGDALDARGVEHVVLLVVRCQRHIVLHRGPIKNGFEAKTSACVFKVICTAFDSQGPERVPGQEFDEGYLLWRCADCEEMGP